MSELHQQADESGKEADQADKPRRHAFAEQELRLISALVVILGLGLLMALPFVLSIGSVVFLPVVTAIILTIILSPLADRLARFKQPKRVFFVDELPRNTMGKVQKNLLRDRYAGIFPA